MDIVTLSQLTTIAKLHADMVNSDFNNDAEWTILINDGVRQYWSLVEQLTQDYYFTQSYFSIVPNQLAYPLPQDLYHLRGVDVGFSIQNLTDLNDARNLWITLAPFMFAERNSQAYLYYQIVAPPFFSRYRIQGNSIVFEPLTSVGSNIIRLSYTQIAPKLQSPSDTVNVISGFDQYIAKIAAMHAKAREESDVSLLAADIMKMESEIKQLADDRNRDTAPRVQDTNAKYFNVWGF